jgi:hypothetical protein
MPSCCPAVLSAKPITRPHRLSRSRPSLVSSRTYPIAGGTNASAESPPDTVVAGIEYRRSNGSPAHGTSRNVAASASTATATSPMPSAVTIVRSGSPGTGAAYWATMDSPSSTRATNVSTAAPLGRKPKRRSSRAKSRMNAQPSAASCPSGTSTRGVPSWRRPNPIAATNVTATAPDQNQPGSS